MANQDPLATRLAQSLCSLNQSRKLYQHEFELLTMCRARGWTKFELSTCSDLSSIQCVYSHKGCTQ